MAQMIDSLTPEQCAEFPRFRNRWVRLGKSTQRIDKEKTREAIMKCYDESPMRAERPRWVVFVQSPFQLFYVRPIWNRMAHYIQQVKRDNALYVEEGAKQPEGALWYTLNDRFKTDEGNIHDTWELRIHAIATVWDAIIDAIKGDVPDIEFKGNECAFYRALAWLQQDWIANAATVLPEIVQDAQKDVGKENYGQNETWLCFFEFLEWAGCKGLDDVRPLQEYAQHGGWWISYDVVAAVSDRPIELHLDDDAQLHSHTRPAILFADGWRHYASHGMEIPAWFVEEPEKITLEKILDQSNIELRRVMLEIFGMDALLKEGKAILVDRDPDPHTGTLWRVPMWDEDIWLLELLNSTPESDGSYKTYVIRVPPNMLSAKQALAHSFQFINPDDYCPILQA